MRGKGRIVMAMAIVCMALAAPALANACTVTWGSSFSVSNPRLNIIGQQNSMPTSVLVAGIGWSPDPPPSPLDSTHWLYHYHIDPPIGYIAGHTYSVDVFWDNGTCFGHHTGTITATS